MPPLVCVMCSNALAITLRQSSPSSVWERPSCNGMGSTRRNSWILKRAFECSVRCSVECCHRLHMRVSQDRACACAEIAFSWLPQNRATTLTRSGAPHAFSALSSRILVLINLTAFAATKTSGGYVVSQLKAVQRIPRYGVVWATPVHCVAIATTDLGVAASIVKTIVNAAEVWFASSEVSSCLSQRVCWRGCCTS